MHLPPSTALLLIDLQNAVDHPTWGPRNNPQAEANILRLLAAWRASRSPVVHVRHLSRQPGSTFGPGTPGVGFKPGFDPHPGERVLEKSVPGAFTGTDLESFLRGLVIDTLVITGVATSNSVEATARVAGDLGFHTIVVADATFTFARVDFHGTPRTADEVHAMSLANLHGEYATVLDTETILRARAVLEPGPP
jgi:nicotinamidase-related amidase